MKKVQKRSTVTRLLETLENYYSQTLRIELSDTIKKA
jgi:hypothetical protein